MSFLHYICNELQKHGVTHLNTYHSSVHLVLLCSCFSSRPGQLSEIETQFSNRKDHRIMVTKRVRVQNLNDRSFVFVLLLESLTFSDEICKSLIAHNFSKCGMGHFECT